MAGRNPRTKDFFSDLQIMEDLAALQANQKANEAPQDWEEDARDPLEKLMITKDRPVSTPTFVEHSGSSCRGRGKRRSNFSRGRWNNNRKKASKEEFEGSLPSYSSNRSSFTSGSDVSQRSSFHQHGWSSSFSNRDKTLQRSPFHQHGWSSSFSKRGKTLQRSPFHPPRAFRGRESSNFMNYYESDIESIADVSSLDGFSSVSEQMMSISPCQLARSLVEFPDYQATLLALFENCEYDPKQVRQVVTKCSRTLEIDGEVVRLRPKIVICRRHLDTDGCLFPQTCQDVHICLQYLTGRCRNPKCLYGHTFHTDHNKPIFNAFYLNIIPAKLLFGLCKFLVMQSGGPAEELEVCEGYNAGSCSNKQCQKLHLCLKLLAKRCSPDDGCKLNHSTLEKHSSAILESQGVSLNESPRDILTHISSLPLIKREIEVFKSVSSESVSDEKQSQSKEATSGGKAASDKSDDASGAKMNTKTESDENKTSVVASSREMEKPVSVKTAWSHDSKGEVAVDEICYNSVEGFCPYEETGCWRLHCDFHFHWQVRSSARDKERFWINLTKEQALALEKDFCDPSISKIPLPTLDGDSGKMPPAKDLRVALSGRSKWEADFDAMQLIPDKGNKNASLELRRLCTEYSPNNSIPEACVFKWYFLDKNQKWIEYGNIDSTGEEKLKCSITSDDIEKFRRQNGEDSVMQFNNQSFVYLLDLTNMTQINLETNVTRKVRRRPQSHLKDEKSSMSVSKGDIPVTWEPMQPEELMRRVVLSSSSQEYQNMMTHIKNNGGSGINVLKIERVQNPYLWRAFQNKVQEMTSLYKDPSTVDVRQLFHGTNPESVPKICQENFDWRLHGTNAGQACGRGTYFSPFASTSHGYSRSDSTGNRFMFIARVAVGTMTPGNSGMTRPPMNPQYNVPYDATVNDTNTPSIIVKYDKQEYFPEYIIAMT